ncbi:MAG TPA: FAD-binding protein [Mycobacteriales bacterium]|nr:FAD-binding protein [Mycobacteriales bacterium]
MGANGPDLLVAGAGGGLAGAVLAARSGLSVLVVDSSEHFLRGSNTAMSTAMIPGAGSRFQRQAGVVDSPRTFVEDVMRKTHGQADPTLTAALAEVSAELVEWLDEIGVPMHLVTDFDYPGHSVTRCHTVPGRSGARLLANLHDIARHTANLDILVPARLVDLDAAGAGWVATVARPGGAAERIPCGNVLLATNGFGANADLVARYLPEIAGATYHGSDQSTGDALRIGARLGAATGYLDAYQGHGALAAGANTLAGWALVMHGGIIVNSHGDRFADETTGYSEFAAIELTQPGHWAVIVFDRRIRDLCAAFDDYLNTERSGVVRWGDAGVIAGAFGLDRARLLVALAGAESARNGAVDAFGRAGWGPEPLIAPYGAVRVRPALFHTQGGLRVDGSARVLDGRHDPIGGLYAAGGAAMGISGHGAAGYLAGNGLITALGLSYLAARHVAATRTAAG